MIALVAGLALSVAACAADPAKDAEDQFNIVAKTGTSREKCDAARKVSEAWLKAKEESNYRRWDAIADQHCMSASLGT